MLAVRLGNVCVYERQCRFSLLPVTLALCVCVCAFLVSISTPIQNYLFDPSTSTSNHLAGSHRHTHTYTHTTHAEPHRQTHTRALILCVCDRVCVLCSCERHLSDSFWNSLLAALKLMRTWFFTLFYFKQSKWYLKHRNREIVRNMIIGFFKIIFLLNILLANIIIMKILQHVN